MRDFYKASEILFGTREKYLELRKEILALEALTDISKNRRIRNVKYSISEDYMDIPDNEQRKIRYSLIENQYNLKGFIDYFASFVFSGFHDFPHSITYSSGNLRKDKNGKYSFDEGINIANQEKFEQIVERILEMDFVKSMDFRHFRIGNNIDNPTFSIGQNGITISAIYHPHMCFLNYSLQHDSLVMGLIGKPHPVTRENMQELLNLEVEASKLSDYQKSLIDSSKSATKKFLIDDFKSKLIDFDIEEYPDTIHIASRKKLHL